MNQPENMTLQATLEKSSENAKANPLAVYFSWLGRGTLLLALLVTPWCLGSVDYLAQFWISLILLIGLAVYWFESAVERRGKQVFPYVVVFLFLGVLIGLLQIAPLPSSIVEMLGGRQAEIYQTYSVDAQQVMDGTNGDIASPRLTVDRGGTLNNLRLLIIAIGGLLLGCRLFKTKTEMMVLFVTVTVSGVAVAFFGIAQKLSFNGKIFWVIDVIQGSQPFGPFVNRNNASGYLLMCLAASFGLLGLVLAQRVTAGPRPMVSKEIPPWRQLYFHFLFFVAELNAAKVASMLAAVIIATGVVATLSRGGVMALLIAGLVTLIVYGMARKPKHSGFILIPMVFVVFGLSYWIGFGQDAVARFESTDIEEVIDKEYRIRNWRDTFPAATEMGLLGSGLGTYSKVHRMYRSDNEEKMFVFAENQYFESLIEGGWISLAMFVAAWLLCWWYASILINRGTSPTSIASGTCGIFLVSSQAVAAFLDFGLYMPANMLLMSVMIGFLAYQAQSLAGRLKKKTWLRFQVKNVVVQGVLLAVFAASTMVCLDLSRRDSISEATEFSLEAADYETLDLPATEAAIKTLSPLLKKTSSAEGLNYLAGLWVHRCRLQFFEKWTNDPAVKDLAAEKRGEMKDELWKFTHLSRLNEHMNYLKNSQSESLAVKFVDTAFVSENLQPAYRYYAISRKLSPLEPFNHLQLGRINALFGLTEKMNVDLERAVELSPSNAQIRLSVARMYLQNKMADKATQHFRRALELNDRLFGSAIRLMTGRLNRDVEQLPTRVIFERVLPDNPRMIYRTAINFAKDDEILRNEMLLKADTLLEDVSLSDRDAVLLTADVKFALGDKERGLERLRDVLISDPTDRETRFRLGKLYLEEGMVREAHKEAEYLYRLDSRDRRYRSFFEEAEKELDNYRFGKSPN